MSDLVITPETRVGALLDAHPELEATLIGIAPTFKALRNPVLRRTVAKVATLEQAARVAEMPVNELVRALREALGQDTSDLGVDGAADDVAGAAPGWVADGARRELDADALLAEGQTPVAELGRILAELDSGGVVLVRSTFHTAPLLDAMRAKGHTVFTRKLGDDAWEAWIRKQ
jgi:hypothetical protein